MLRFYTLVFMGFYNICLSEQASNARNLILSWVKYRYKCLTMVLRNCSEISRRKWMKFSADLSLSGAYIYDQIVIVKVNWSNHFKNLELTLQKLQDSGLKCNVEKSFFGQTNMEYLGFWVNQTGFKSINNNKEDVVNMTPSKNTQEVRLFIVIVNYCRDMWSRRAHPFHYLTELTSNKLKFKLTDLEQKLFYEIKRAISQDTILA